MRTPILLLCMLALCACERRPATAVVALAGGAEPCVAADTAAQETDWEYPNQDSLHAVIDSLDGRIASAPNDELPRLLYDRGAARMYFMPNIGTTHERYARAHPDDYWYNEVGADWLYTGTDLRELIRRFPQHELVDDAAYMMTRLPLGGECEGYVPCYTGSTWGPVSEFLAAYPQSPYADSAVARALVAFGHIEPDAELRASSAAYEPNDIRQLISSLDSVARLLPERQRVPLLTRAGELWTQLVEYDRARAAYSAAAAGATPAVRACIEQRLAAVPARWFVLDTIIVIQPRRLVLTWQRVDGATEFMVTRWTSHAADAQNVARVSAATTTWADTTTAPDTLYWYRVSALAQDTVHSNPAPARTPSLETRVHGAAVSSSLQRLYVFGALDNGFPQVLEYTFNGELAARHNALVIGPREPYYTFTPWLPYVSEVFVADRRGIGVLRFDVAHGQLPAALFASARRNAILLRGPLDGGSEPVVSVDEAARVLWLEPGGAGRTAATALDCTRRICWRAHHDRLVRLDADGTVIATADLSDENIGAVYADSASGSAWVLLQHAGQLLHFDSAGRQRAALTLAPPERSYSITTAYDPGARVIWFTRTDEKVRTQLQRIDVSAANPQPELAAPDVDVSVPRLAPDGVGGVFLVDHRTIARYSGDGREVFRAALNRE